MLAVILLVIIYLEDYMNKANKITMVRIIMSVMIILLLLFPFDQVGVEFPTYLINKNVLVKLEYVIATHPDGDHIGGMASLFESFEIETLIKFEGSYSTQKYKKMETAMFHKILIL